MRPQVPHQRAGEWIQVLQEFELFTPRKVRSLSFQGGARLKDEDLKREET